MDVLLDELDLSGMANGYGGKNPTPKSLFPSSKDPLQAATVLGALMARIGY